MPLDMLISEANGLSDDALMEVVRFMRFLKTERKETGNESGEGGKKRRKAGMYAGQIWMAEDFDEPLEDFREYM